MADTYAYKPRSKSYSDAGAAARRKEERRGLLRDEEDILWDPVIREAISRRSSVHYGTLPGHKEKFARKSKTLLSAGDGMQANVTFENICVHAIRHQQNRWFANRQYSEIAGEGPTQLLTNVSGIVRAGEVMAVMGASGAGKSTLMNVLTNRNLSDNLLINGSVKVNGVELGTGISKISGYVQQDDLFFPTLTVKETLRFQAALKIGNLLSTEEREARIAELLDLMGLRKCQNTRIGLPGVEKSISGGESKRLAFASELIVNPAILFCDEPTTGLDSFMAEQVVNVLKQLAQQGKTIICVIHQPSSVVFSMFTKLLLMAEGRVAFQGSLPRALQYFDSLGYPCPESYNPAEHYIKTLAVSAGNVTRCRERIKAICDAYDQSPEAAEIRMELDLVSGKDTDIRTIFAFDESSNYKVSVWMQLRWLLWRGMLDNLRNPDMFRVRTIQKIIIAFIYGMIYYHGAKLTQEGVQNINGALFLYMTENSFAVMLDLVLTFQRAMPLFRREYAAYMFRLPIYYLAQVIGWLPSFAVDASVFCVITYLMVGLARNLYKFAITFLMCILTSNVAAASGSLVSTMSPSVDVGLVVAPTLTVVVMLFGGGVYLKLRTLPKFLAWLQWFSWFRYGNEILGIVHWQDVHNITCSGKPGTACLQNGAEVMHDFEYDPDKLELDLGLVCALFAGFHLLAFLFLYLRNRR